MGVNSESLSHPFYSFPISTLTGHRTLRSTSLLHHILSFYAIIPEASLRKIQGTRRDVTRCDDAPLIPLLSLDCHLAGRRTPMRKQGCMQATAHRGTAQNDLSSNHAYVILHSARHYVELYSCPGQLVGPTNDIPRI
jgi:hypothetical protein